MDSSSPVARQVAPSKTVYKAVTCMCIYTIQRELPHGSAMRMCHFMVTLSVEFAGAGTAQKAHYEPDTNNRCDISVHH